MGISPLLDRALEYVAATDFAWMEDGRREIDGDRLFALVQSYTTKPGSEVVFEAHRAYTDLQLVVRGREAIGWAPTSSLTSVEAYSAERDLEFFTGAEALSLPLQEGWFAVLLPQDAHKPCCELRGAAQVRKVVVKIAIEE
jgi:YhcH/YjgK/YiaL family protein